MQILGFGGGGGGGGNLYSEHLFIMVKLYPMSKNTSL